MGNFALEKSLMIELVAVPPVDQATAPENAVKPQAEQVQQVANYVIPVPPPESISPPEMTVSGGWQVPVRTNPEADAVQTRRQEIERRLSEIVERERQAWAEQQRNSPTATSRPDSGSNPSAPVRRERGLTLSDMNSLPYDLEVLALMRAIIGKESGGNPRAVNPHSGALGYGQVMPSNLRAWSREALGRSISRREFLNSPDVQLRIIGYRLNKYWRYSLAAANGNEAIAVRKVASLWYSGRANLFNSYASQFYNGYRYPSIAEYTLSVLRRYQSAKRTLLAMNN